MIMWYIPQKAQHLKLYEGSDSFACISCKLKSFILKIDNIQTTEKWGPKI